MAIEREFSVAIPEGKVDDEVFHSVRTLAIWLADRLARGDQGDPSEEGQPSEKSAGRSARPKAVAP